MASTPLGDIPGARFGEGFLGSFAAVASGGANGVLGYFGPYAYPIRPRAVFYTPTSGNQVATQTATYRRLSVVNGGPSGTATTTVAFVNLTASAASFTPISWPDPGGAVPAVPAGSLLYFSQATVGGTDANGTALAGGQFALAYEIA